MSNNKLNHARFELPTPPVELPAKHPLKDEKTHQRLVEYVKARLSHDLPNRDARVDRYSQIDRDVAAFLQLDEQDKKRALKHEITGDPQAIKVSLPLMFVHLDDMMTYYAQTFAPNRGMFYHTAKPDETPEATQLVMLMNNHAIHGGYYKQLLRSIFSILKYNVGGVTVSWDTEYGPKLGSTGTGEVELQMEPVFIGNRIKSIDMYNCFYDPAVEAQELYREGEFFALAEVKSHYWLKSKCLEGAYFNCSDMLDGESAGFSTTYYKDPPVESRIADDESKAQSFSWFSYLSGSDNYLLNGAYELVTMYIRINPNDFNLVAGNAQARSNRNG